jgi:6-phosphogluconate dehydrogenase
MTLLFQEHGATISLLDLKKETLSEVKDKASKAPSIDAGKVKTFLDMKEFMQSFPAGQPRIIVFSLPHGSTADKIIDQLEPLLNPGDILIDCGNEWWEDTERRQARTSSKDFGRGPVHYLGCGVSGGYQSARHGPSMSPGGTREAYDKVVHLLKKWACKAKDGSPCVDYIGKGGAGHHVKVSFMALGLTHP